MAKTLLEAACNKPLENFNEIKQDVYLFPYQNEEYIIKTKSSGFFKKLTQQNEIEFYKNINAKFQHLQIPKYYGICSDNKLVIEFIEGEKNKKAPADIFVPAYLEFQKIPETPAPFFNFKYRLLRGFSYRVCSVSIVTLSRKISFKKILKILYLFLLLNFQQKRFKKTFRLHGDLQWKNMMKNHDNKLALIDFENTFITKKWPLAEITRLSFFFNGKNIEFSDAYLLMYLEHIESNTSLKGECLKRQIRFGVLQNSIAQFVQANGAQKRTEYKKLLNMVLDEKKFNQWYISHIGSKI
jgi:hypothetical protein